MTPPITALLLSLPHVSSIALCNKNKLCNLILRYPFYSQPFGDTNMADVTSGLFIYLSLSQQKPMTIRVPTEIVVYVVVFRSSIRVQPNKNHGGRGSRFWCKTDFLRVLIRRYRPCCWNQVSLRRRRNLTPVSNVREAKSLLWAPKGLRLRFEFPFNLIGKSTMTFLTGQSWRVLKSWYTGGGPEQRFRRWAQANLVEVSYILSRAWILEITIPGHLLLKTYQ